jgi:prepilin-type N-terminal cleavage/methylation domain-containing protein
VLKVTGKGLKMIAQYKICKVKKQGFTLVEFLITIVIVSILLVLAAPSFTDFINNQRVKTSASDLFTSLLYARSEAIMRNANVSVIAHSSGWASGWAITTTAGKTYAQCVADSSDCLKIKPALTNTIISNIGAPASVIYGRQGTTTTATIELCDASGSSSVAKKRISIPRSGTPRVTDIGWCP